MKNIITLAAIIVILIGGFFAFNAYIYNEKQADGPAPALVARFQEYTFERATEGGLIPIEGYDADLLMSAFPQLLPSDFEGVESFEGVYSVKDGRVIYTRTQDQPVSSAERTISEEGYATLLENVSVRLQFPVKTETDVEALVDLLSRTNNTIHADSDVQLSFEYRGEGTDAYLLRVLEKDAYTDPTFIKLFSLINKEEYEEFMLREDASEGPPSINIAVFENLTNESASTWTDSHPELSNLGLLTGEVNRDAVIGGANAVRFVIDGLYPTRMVVVAHGGFIYVISGSYLEGGDQIEADFEPLLRSIVFIQDPELL